MSDDAGKPVPQPARDDRNPSDAGKPTDSVPDTAAIFPEIRQIVEQAGLSNVKKEELVGRLTAVIVERHFSGPLPHPEILQGYTELIPNGGERVMGLTERQSAHRIKQENRVILHEIMQTYVGQFMAFAISGAFLYAAYQLGMAGHDALAGVLGGTTLVGLAGVFIYGKKKQEQDLEAKRPAGPPNRKKGQRR